MTSKANKKLILTHAIVRCHFMAFLCFFPSYLLLLTTSFFLHSVVNKVQSNLLSKCSFLSLFLSSSLFSQGNLANSELVGWRERSDQRIKKISQWPVLRPSSRGLVGKEVWPANRPGASRARTSGMKSLVPALTIQPENTQGESIAQVNTHIDSSIHLTGAQFPMIKCEAAVWVITKKNPPKGICRNTAPVGHQISFHCRAAGPAWTVITLNHSDMVSPPQVAPVVPKRILWGWVKWGQKFCPALVQ